MYNVVIVDDEPLVLFGVSAILNNCGRGFRIINSFKEGASALEFCRENPPHLLLTDIRMPGLDGLSLIRQLKSLHPETKIVVLSCHEEFELVHQAFRLGAEEYLLKHNLEEDSFIQLLAGLFPQGEGAAEDGETHWNTMAHWGDGILGIVGFKGEWDDELRELPWEADGEILRQIIRGRLDRPGVSCISGPQDEILIYLPRGGGGEAGIGRRERKLFDTVRQSLGGYINRRVFLSLVPVSSGEGKAAYQTALALLEEKFYHPEGCLLLKDAGGSDRGTHRRPVFTVSGRSSLERWMETLDPYLEGAKASHLPPSLLRSDLAYALHHLIYELEALTEGHPGAFGELRSENFYNKILLFDDWEILRRWMRRELEEISFALENQSGYWTLSRSVQEHIKHHFATPISLPEMASRFHVTPPYLSTCFKQETGMSFIEFVNKTRIDHACGLLISTGLTAKEIAFKAGYENPNYFSRIFKKITGKTVSEYRTSALGMGQ